MGLPDAAIRESRERVRAAITNSKYFFPFHKTTINLAPADVREEGAAFDLPMALGILGAAGDLGVEDSEGTLSVGELSLDGRVRPVRGALSITAQSSRGRCKEYTAAGGECVGGGGCGGYKCLSGEGPAARRPNSFTT